MIAALERGEILTGTPVQGNGAHLAKACGELVALQDALDAFPAWVTGPDKAQ